MNDASIEKSNEIQPNDSCNHSVVVCIVEDSKSIRFMMSLYLKQLGYKISFVFKVKRAC